MPGELALYNGNKYNKASDGLFDVLAKADLGKLAGELGAPTNFGETLAQMVKEKKLQSKSLSALSKEVMGTEDWGDAVARVGDELVESAVNTAVGVGTKAVTVAATTAFGPIIGALSNIGGELISSVVGDYFKKQEGARTREMYMLPGQWVYINDGPTRGGRNPEDEGGPLVLGDYDYTSDMFRRRLMKFPEKEQKNISYGFFIGDAENLERVNVFSCKRMQKEYLFKDNVRAVEISEARKFDADKILKRVKDAWFADYKIPEQMYTTVNTDPGAEVVWKGELWNIVRCTGSMATIEDEVGTRNMVSLDKLDPGRTTHTNSWNYGSRFDTSFFADGSATLHSGMFVWVPARDAYLKYTAWEMAVIRNIGPDGVHSCCLIDGEYIVAEEVWPLDDDMQEMLNADKKYVTFAEHATRGASCTGIVQFDRGDQLMLLGKTAGVAGGGRGR